MSEQTNNTAAVAQVEQPTGSAVAIAGLFGDLAGSAYCSVSEKAPNYARIIAKCEEEPDGRLAEHVNTPIVITDVYAHRVELTSTETGEVVPVVRCCLIGKDGKVYSAVSEGIRKSIFRLMRSHGVPSWPKGITVIPKVRKLAGGHQWLWLAEPEEQPTKGTK